MTARQVLTPLLDELAARYGALRILETGTIRGEGENYRDNDGWSTLVFAEAAQATGGMVTSIDLDTKVATRVLADHGLLGVVKLIEAHSIDAMGELLLDQEPFEIEPYHLIYLDSDNDAELILHEFFLARRMVRAPGYVLVDDVDMDSEGVVKGHAIVPFLDKAGIEYRIEERRSDDYATGILIIPFGV